MCYQTDKNKYEIGPTNYMVASQFNSFTVFYVGRQ